MGKAANSVNHEKSVKHLFSKERRLTLSRKPNRAVAYFSSVANLIDLMDDILDRDVAVRPLVLNFDRLDLIDNIHSFDHLAEDRVAVVVLIDVIETFVVHHVDEKLRRRAIDHAGACHRQGAATVAQAVGRFVLDRRKGFSFPSCPAPMPPPWIMKLLMTRWKMVPL